MTAPWAPGATVRIREGVTDPMKGLVVAGAEYHIEDLWIKVAGQSWMDSDGNPAAMLYGIRSGLAGLPIDNDVLYGKISGLGCLVHVSEIEVAK
jgi:hypothetical protein